MVKADDIFLFVLVVDEGSFSAAAERMELTNSVVSKRIGRLEDALNTQLLYRTTRKLSLTEAGSALYGKARLAKQALDDARNAVTAYGETIQGKIRVTAPAVSSDLVLGDAIVSFCERYPNVEIELSVNNHFVDLINEGFDLAIRTARLEDSSLIARRLVDSHWMVVASPQYLKRHGQPHHPEELQKHQCLLYKSGQSRADQWLLNINGKETPTPVQGRFQTNNLGVLKQACLGNFGIAYLPRALVYENLKNGTLIAILNEYLNTSLGIYAVYPRTRQPDKKLTLLVEHFRDAFQAKQAHYF